VRLKPLIHLSEKARRIIQQVKTSNPKSGNTLRASTAAGRLNV